MEVTIYPEPCWLLEAAEMVYGLVNRIPPAELAGSGSYCIPPEQVRVIQDQACAGIDPAGETAQYYFRGVPLEGVANRLSCLGCAILYSSLSVDCSDPAAYAAAARAYWHDRRAAGLRVDGIDCFSLILEEAQEKTISLAKELLALQVPELYRLQLLEVFSAFDWHLDRLMALLEPVARRLPALMAPWTEKIPVLAQQWQSFFQTASAQDFFLHRARLQAVPFQQLEIAFRFMSPDPSPGKYSADGRRARFHLGVSIAPNMEIPSSAQPPEEWELTALRLMANSARVEMLRLMAQRPMSGQELAQKLNLNSGSVFRDLNSLRNARLLLMETIGGRNCYRTNVPAVRQITSHIADYVQNDG